MKFIIKYSSGVEHRYEGTLHGAKIFATKHLSSADDAVIYYGYNQIYKKYFISRFLWSSWIKIQ